MAPPLASVAKLIYSHRDAGGYVFVVFVFFGSVATAVVCRVIVFAYSYLYFFYHPFVHFP